LTTVLVHLDFDFLGTDRMADHFPGVRFVHVDPDGPVDPDLHGEVMVTRGTDSANFAEVLERGVRWVHCTGHGVDEIPLDVVEDRTLTCARGATAVPIAEWVVAMLLTAAKRLPGSWVDEPPRHWFLARLDTIEDATIALVGYGSINRAVAARLAPFGCRILAVRRSDAPIDDPGVEVVGDVATAVAEADHVVIGVPSTTETENLVDADLLAACRTGTHLVNIARGPVVDQSALRSALDSGQVGLASLDVCDPEPLPEGHWLYTHPGVRLSPHISWCSPTSLEQMGANFAANLERWLEGRPLNDIVDHDTGY